MTVKHSQQTSCCSETVRLLGYALGGEAGCRLAKRLAIRTSPDTVLRKVKRRRVADPDCPKFLGIDDWAWRKAQRYGTILVDLETRRPIDLLSDRSADSLAAWLKQHPTVQLISRDRAESYADGASRGSPQAIQVADRFHLLCNLTSAIERVLETKRSELSQASEPDEPKVKHSVLTQTPIKMSAQERSKQRRECRLERYNKVIELHLQGMSNQAIAQMLQIGRKTVGRFLRSEIFPERATPRRKAPRVNKFRAYLEKRWAEGCHNATALYREIKTQGYLGGRSMVARLVYTFRTPETQYPRKRNQQSAPKARRRPLSPRQAGMLIARAAEKLNDAAKQLLKRLEQCCPEIPPLQLRVTGFSAVFKNHDPAAPQGWIEHARAMDLTPIKTFCDGLLRDQAAVKAAIC